jgi:hypothetical protein
LCGNKGKINESIPRKNKGNYFVVRKFSTDEKNALLRSILDADKQWTITDFKLDRTEKVKRTTAILLEETIGELEEKRKAIEETNLALQRSFKIQEEKNHELSIEASLERVRTKAMAMQKPDDMLGVCRLISDELHKYNVTNIRNVQTVIFNKPVHEYINYQYFAPYDKDAVEVIDYEANEIVKDFALSMLASKDAFYSKDFGEKELQGWIEHRRQTNQLTDPLLDKASSLHYYFYAIESGALGMSTYAPVEEEILLVLKRFRNVFELAYRRYRDIAKAEAQAREAQIEASLERVRSAALTMHKSDDLRFSLTKLFEELDKLQLGMVRCGIAILDPSKPRADVWIMAKTMEHDVIQLSGDEPLDTNFMLLEAYQAWKKGDDYEYLLQSEDLDLYYQSLSQIKFQADITATYVKKNDAEKQHYFNAVFKHGSLFAFFDDFMPDEAKTILKRFANVLNLAYSRFLDIQSSEAQAREARVETALERVRSRTMAMQKSDELAEVAKLLFKQVKELGIAAWTTGFNIWSDDNNSYVDYVTDPQGNFINPYTVYTDDAPEVIRELRDARKSGIEFFEQYAEGERLKETYMALMKFGDQEQYEKILKDGFDFPSHQYDHFVFGSKASLMFITYDRVPECHDLFKRFGKAFEQTYTRFLDLQKSEAQAREAQVELALERVRARTMAMFKSDELADVAAVLFEQLHQLGDTPERINIGIVNEEAAIIEWWLTEQDGRMIDRRFIMAIDEPIYMAKMYKGWKEKNKSLVIEIGGQELTQWLEYIRQVVGIPFRHEFLQQTRVNTVAFFSQGMIALTTAEQQTPETILLLERFAKVFEQTYTRFLDLKKAEAQARESKIEMALEKVRSRTMAMQKSGELSEAASLLFKQIADLGTTPWSSGFDIWDEEGNAAMAWMANPDGSMGSPFLVPYIEDPFFKRIHQARQSGNDFFVMESGGQELENTYRYLFNLPSAKKHFDGIKALGFQMPAFQITHCAFFSQGYLMFITYEPVEEMWDIFKRFAKVFEQTYTRFP